MHKLRVKVCKECQPFSASFESGLLDGGVWVNGSEVRVMLNFSFSFFAPSSADMAAIGDGRGLFSSEDALLSRRFFVTSRSSISSSSSSSVRRRFSRSRDGKSIGCLLDTGGGDNLDKDFEVAAPSPFDFVTSASRMSSSGSDPGLSSVDGS